MAVTSSNRHAPNKGTRFVGICIQRSGCGLRANFILRNVINHVGQYINLYMLYIKVNNINFNILKVLK